VRDAATSRKTLIDLFERIHFFLQRLEVYAEVRLTEGLTELLGKTMGQLLIILAVSTRMMAEKKMCELIRFLFYPLVDLGSVGFLKRLMGRNNVEDALLRLDKFTQEECLMTAARTLEVTHRVANVVRNVDGSVKVTKSLVEAIDENVKATKALTKEIEANVTKMTKILTEVHECIKVVERDVSQTRASGVGRRASGHMVLTWLDY
jgi:hypothetical protein